MKTTITVFLIQQLYGLTSCVTKRHFFIDQKKIQEEARLHCKTYFYDLSTFTNSIEKQEFLQDAVGQNSDAWIGLEKGSGVLEWKCLGNEVATALDWDKDKPDSKSNNNNCVFIHKDHKLLHDKPCSEYHTFFCMTISEFVLVEQIETWETALEVCRDHYEDLASLSSSRQMDYAQNKTIEAPTEYVWIGLRFLAGDWVWISRDDLNYKPWSQSDEPQCPARNQHCGAIDKKMKIFTPRDCGEKLSFLCLHHW